MFGSSLFFQELPGPIFRRFYETYTSSFFQKKCFQQTQGRFQKITKNTWVQSVDFPIVHTNWFQRWFSHSGYQKFYYFKHPPTDFDSILLVITKDNVNLELQGLLEHNDFINKLVSKITCAMSIHMQLAKLNKKEWKKERKNYFVIY